MKYMGSKQKIAKYIVPVICKELSDHKLSKYMEPFVGGANIIESIKCNTRVASDINPYLIALYKNLDKLELLPDNVSKEHYSEVRSCFNNNGSEFEQWYMGAIGFLSSYNGRFFDGGYSGKRITKDGKVRDYYLEAKHNLCSQAEKLRNINFLYSDYRDLEDYIDIKDFVIYCDPPYENTKQYLYSKNFNYDDFWNWCRKQSEHNIVIISEQTAPDDFDCIWSNNVSRTINYETTKNSAEKLFSIHK